MALGIKQVTYGNLFSQFDHLGVVRGRLIRKKIEK